MFCFYVRERIFRFFVFCGINICNVYEKLTYTVILEESNHLKSRCKFETKGEFT